MMSSSRRCALPPPLYHPMHVLAPLGEGTKPVLSLHGTSLRRMLGKIFMRYLAVQRSRTQCGRTAVITWHKPAA